MNRQFDVYASPLKAGRDERPFLIDIQHHFLADRPSRVVAPLVVTSAIRPEPRLNPQLTVMGKRYYFSPTEIFTLSAKFLRSPVANLESERERILVALDLMVLGI